MGDVLIRVVAGFALAGLLPVSPALAADDDDRPLFTFKDPRITESSGLALSPTRDDVYYTHNDSDAGATFFAVDGKGQTRATFTVAGAEARDWEGMAASKDPKTGRGVLWFADIGDNFDGAWPDISIYKVMEPTSFRDATLPATRYRFTYEDGGHNAEGIMVHPRTGRLSVVTKQFSGAIYEAPKRLRTGRVNVLRKIGPAPIMATDAAYAPDGSSFVIRTYFSASVFRAPGELIAKVSMPQLDQAESIAYSRDGRSLLVGSEGVNSPVYEVPLPDTALPTPTPSASAEPSAEASPEATVEGGAVSASQGGGLTTGDILLWVAAAVGATGVITVIARKAR
ncbi:hypothetical protein [Nonomuraea sp. NPDC046570]|uniref:hypothetical protein n=1 Tax=Nonomuraea sp. NPDC046570 TaxID=3155255 RepID=UPI0033FA46F4